MQRLCQKLTIGRYASTGDRRSDLTYRHGSDFGAGRKRRENLRQTRDTELENDPDKRSETARPNISLMHLVARVHWENNREHAMRKIKVTFKPSTPEGREICEAITKAEGSDLLQMALHRHLQQAFQDGLKALNK